MQLLSDYMSKISCMFYIDNDRYASQQGFGRILPKSIRPQVPNPISTNLVENVGCSQMSESYVKTSSAQPKLTYVADSLKYQTAGRGGDDKLIISTTSGGRILPHSMMLAKSTSTSQHTSSVDPVFRSLTGEERANEYDERLIFQAALQVIFSGHVIIYASPFSQLQMA